MWLELKAARGRAENAVPDARRAVVRRQADRPGVVPQPAVDQFGEGEAGMAADHAVDTIAEQVEFARLGGGRRRREDEAVDRRDAALDRGEPVPTDRKMNSPPQRSEERRVGKECVSQCRSRRSPYH